MLNEKALQQIEQMAQGQGIPIIAADTAVYLRQLVLKVQPHKILEIGTAVGYSTAVLLAEAAADAMIWTVELDQERAATAQMNLERLQLSAQVRLLVGDALTILPQLQEKFDLIFIDGPKGQYPRLWSLADQLVAPAGIIVADNVAFHGMLQPDAEVPRRIRTIVRRLREYLEIVQNDCRYRTEILDIGDGLAVSYHLGETH